MTEEIVLTLVKESLEKIKMVRFRALGSSMFPFIKNGDIITVKYINSKDIVIGDILLYQRDEKFFVHRLIDKRRNNNNIYYITKGDNLPNSDLPIEISSIKGKVVEIQNDKRRISLDSLKMKIVNYSIAKILTFLIFYIIYIVKKLKHVFKLK